MQEHGDVEVTFAVFMRRRVVAALEPAIRLVKRLVPGSRIKRFFNEGDIVPSEGKMLEITGSMAKLSEIETLLLQKIGFPCVSANNAYEMCRAIPTAGLHGHACPPWQRGGNEHSRRLWRGGRQRRGAKRADREGQGLRRLVAGSDGAVVRRRGAAWAPCRMRWSAIPAAMCWRR